jgi:hypothetical protein
MNFSNLNFKFFLVSFFVSLTFGLGMNEWRDRAVDELGAAIVVPCKVINATGRVKHAFGLRVVEQL